MKTRMRDLLYSGLILVLLLAVIVPAVQAASDGPTVPVCYVNHLAGGTNSGATWADAYTDLQLALGNPTCSEIWVATGTYKPTSGAVRTATFSMRSNLAIYGGFEGGESSLQQRIDWQAHPAILSGDIDGAGELDSYHVVSAYSVSSNAILDGFTITSGQADGTGPAVISGRGGGMYAENSNVTVRNAIFQDNFAQGGGGMFAGYGGTTLLEKVTFMDNEASINGGGFHTYEGNTATMINVTFSKNSATETNGGGMINWSSNATMTNVLFFNNTAGDWGGGMSNFGGSNAIVINATFWGNSASIEGAGGFDNDLSDGTLYNTILWGNIGMVNSPQIFSTSLFQVNFSLVQGGCNYPITCQNMLPDGADPLFVDAAFGDLHLMRGSPAINSGNNIAVPSGVFTDLDGHARILNGTVDLGAYEAPGLVFLPATLR